MGYMSCCVGALCIGGMNAKTRSRKVVGETSGRAGACVAVGIRLVSRLWDLAFSRLPIIDFDSSLNSKRGNKLLGRAWYLRVVAPSGLCVCFPSENYRNRLAASTFQLLGTLREWSGSVLQILLRILSKLSHERRPFRRRCRQRKS